MLSNSLKQELIQVWKEYGEAIRIAFRFKVGWGVEGSTVAALLEAEDEADVREYIKYLRQEIDALGKMKFVGEP